MSAPRPKGNVWYKEHYDKIAVVVVLIALLGSALFLLLKVNQAHRDLNDAIWDPVDGRRNPYQPIDLSTYQPLLDRLASPFQITTYTNLLLVSDLRVMSVNPEVRTPIPYDADVCPWTQYPQPAIGTRDTTGDGIPDEWYVGFGLDPFDITISSQDMDGDGFTVREEFDAGTSPVDPADHPSYAYKLRVRRVATRPFALRFQGIQEIGEGDVRFMLNVRERDRSYFSRMGETVEGYRIVNFEERTRRGPHGPIDGSVLTLEGADGRQIQLVVNVDYNVEERLAELIFLVDESLHRVSIGDTLTLMERTYKVIDIRRDTVLILDETLGKTVTVGRLEPQDTLPGTVPRGMGPDYEAMMQGFTP